MPKSENCAPEVHTFWPLMIQSPEPSGADGAGARGGDVGAAGGLGEQLAPDLLAAQRRADEALFVDLVAAQVMMVGTHMPRPIWNGLPGVGEVGLFLGEDLRLPVGAAAARPIPSAR